MSVTLFNFNKLDYLKMAEEKGYSFALTSLQKDLMRWEHLAFEDGQKGYQPDLWKALEEVREFSTELWEKSSSALRLKRSQ